MALDAIAELGARNVHITLENGCFALVREERQVRRYRAVAPRLEPVSVVGAGDALLAQWLTATSTGRAHEEALRLAAAAGAASVLEVGRGPLRPGRGAPPRVRRRGPRAAEPVPVLRAEDADWRRARYDRRNLGDPQDKFAKEGLTFDDVLLVPAESAVLPNDVVTATRLTRTIALEIPIVSAAMDTVTEARLAIALARDGGIGVVHRNLSIDDQVAEVDKVKRSEAGMIVEPVTLPPDALVADALELMERYRVSGVPITDEDGASSGSSRTATSASAAVDDARRGRDDEPRPRHGAGRDDARGGAGDPRPPPDREAPDRRRRRPAPGADHRQGHPEARGVPARDEGRARPAPRRRRGRRRDRRARARRRARRGRGRRARRRHRARPLARRARRRPGDQGRARRRGRRRQHRHRRGGRGADRRGCGCAEGRVGPGLDLHDPRRRRRRRARR